MRETRESRETEGRWRAAWPPGGLGYLCTWLRVYSGGLGGQSQRWRDPPVTKVVGMGEGGLAAGDEEDQLAGAGLGGGVGGHLRLASRLAAAWPAAGLVSRLDSFQPGVFLELRTQGTDDACQIAIGTDPACGGALRLCDAKTQPIVPVLSIGQGGGRCGGEWRVSEPKSGLQAQRPRLPPHVQHLLASNRGTGCAQKR
jgi:hypothetical protein